MLTTDIPFSSLFESAEIRVVISHTNGGLNAGYIFLIAIGAMFVLGMIKLFIPNPGYTEEKRETKSNIDMQQHIILKFDDNIHNKRVNITNDTKYCDINDYEYSLTEETTDHDESETSISV